MSLRVGHCLGLIALIGATAVAQRPQDRKVEIPLYDVKSRKDFPNSGDCCDGVVEKLDKNHAVIRFPVGERKEETRTVCPVDLLASGKVATNALGGGYSYLWEDMKVGDTVVLRTLYDNGDSKHYCFAVCIVARPKGKLPLSQKPKEDARYLRDRVFNDILNWEDVLDDDINSALPPRYIPVDFDQPNGPKKLLHPGGLPGNYQTKLDAIRAKKKDDVKATPPEKK